jgi:hypothetical protein
MGVVVCRDWGLGFPEREWAHDFVSVSDFLDFFSIDKIMAHCQTQVGAQVGAGHLRKWEGLCPMTTGPRRLGPTSH